jgi:hypothetical protein
MQARLSEGVTLTDADRRRFRAAPEQEVARSSRAGSTLRNLRPTVIYRQGGVAFSPGAPLLRTLYDLFLAVDGIVEEFAAIPGLNQLWCGGWWPTFPEHLADMRRSPTWMRLSGS